MNHEEPRLEDIPARQRRWIGKDVECEERARGRYLCIGVVNTIAPLGMMVRDVTASPIRPQNVLREAGVPGLSAARTPLDP